MRCWLEFLLFASDTSRFRTVRHDMHGWAISHLARRLVCKGSKKARRRALVPHADFFCLTRNSCGARAVYLQHVDGHKHVYDIPTQHLCIGARVRRLRANMYTTDDAEIH